MSASTCLTIITSAILFASVTAAPFPTTARIGIIGAGPAGIHAAATLKSLGYNNITILERSHRIGGKSYTIYRDHDGNECTQQQDPVTGLVDTSSCVAFEMGT